MRDALSTGVHMKSPASIIAQHTDSYPPLQLPKIRPTNYNGSSRWLSNTYIQNEQRTWAWQYFHLGRKSLDDKSPRSRRYFVPLFFFRKSFFVENTVLSLGSVSWAFGALLRSPTYRICSFVLFSLSDAEHDMERIDDRTHHRLPDPHRTSFAILVFQYACLSTTIVSLGRLDNQDKWDSSTMVSSV